MTFIDIGAEKGSFSLFLASYGLKGWLFEPLPKHHATLNILAKEKNLIFSSLAIDSVDKNAEFFIACDEEGQELDYFHSLQYIESDLRVKHQKKINVTCRSLTSLSNQGMIPDELGILKTDTEGNDLQVIQGMGDLTAEILICEFFTEGLYNGWQDGHPQNLISAAQKKGYDHYIAVIRKHDTEQIELNPTIFLPEQWGNIIFFSPQFYERIEKKLLKLVKNIQSLTKYSPDHLESWLQHHIVNQNLKNDQTIFLEVGASKGEFTKELLAMGFEHGYLIESNSKNVVHLQEDFALENKMQLIANAVEANSGTLKFDCNEEKVKQIIVDELLEEQDIKQPIALIKIDTQGYDLNVICGAEKTIVKNKPWIITKLIYIPIYHQQSPVSEIMEWMSSHGYSFSGLFNAHYTQDGWLAFADGVFVPKEYTEKFTAHFTHVASYILYQEALEQKQFYEKHCHERLAVIEHLKTENKRLNELLYDNKKNKKNILF